MPVLRTLYGGRKDQTEKRPFSSWQYIQNYGRNRTHRRLNTADTAPNTAALTVVNGRQQIEAAITASNTSATSLL